jgi:hypothetical protein
MPGQSHLLDRQWLEGEYLPALTGSALFIGVRWYNAGYQQFMHIGDKSAFLEKRN